MKESELATYVEDLLRLYKWQFTHFRPGMMASGNWVTAMTGDVGFPDYVAVKDRTLFLEIKGTKGKLSDEQVIWLTLIRDAGGNALVLWPDDYDLLVKVLSGEDR